MTKEPPVPQPVPSLPRRALRAGAWTLGTMVVLVGLSAAFLPGYIKGVAIEQIRVQLHREARIGSIAVNPFLLSARVRGFAIAERDAPSEFVAFDELQVRVGLSSLVRRAPVIEELRIGRLRIHLARTAPERYNFSDIVEAILAKPSRAGVPRFELNSLAIDNASILFDDQPTGKRHTIEQVHILLPALSSFADDHAEVVEPTLSAIVNGQPLELRGQTKPFDQSLETTVDLHFTNLDVPTYLAYSPVHLPLRLDRGRLTTELALALLRTKDRGLSATVKGTVKLEDIVLRDPDALAASTPIAAIRSVEARIAELRWPENSLRLDQLTVASPDVVLRRDKGGRLNWQELFTGGAAAPPTTAPAVAEATVKPEVAAKSEPVAKPEAITKSEAATKSEVATKSDAAAKSEAGAKAGAPGKPELAAKPAALQFAIAVAEVTGGTVRYDDLAAPDGPFNATLKSIAIRARGLSNAQGAQAVIDSSAASDAGELHANTATLTLEPFGVTGEVSVKQVRLGHFKPYFGGILAGDLEGTADVLARYAVSPDFNVKVTDASLAVAGLAIRDKARVEFARIGALAVTGAKFDLDQRTISIGGVELRQCSAGIARDARGGWNFATLLKNAGPAPQATSAADPAPPPTRPAAPGAGAPQWTVALEQAKLVRCAVRFEDQAAAQDGAASIVLDRIDAQVSGWSSRPDSRARIDLRTRVNGDGWIAVQGTAGIAPLAADVYVDVSALDLVPLQPYVADRINVRLTSGAVSARGNLSVAMTDVFSASYRGNGGLDKLASTSKGTGEDFLNWGSLQADGLEIALNSPAAKGGARVPLAVALKELALSDFYARLIVNADGSLNAQQVVAEPDAGSAVATSSAAATGAAAAATPGAAASPPVTISRLNLRGGRVNFSDRFIKPNYSANLTDLNGAVDNLSSDFASRASVDIRGRLNTSAPVEIKGSINPLRGNLYLDLTASCRDIELPPFTPYAQKYAGYGITKGKLSFQAKYLIEDRKLTAENNLFVDQLTFGDKVDSPDATSLPVLFAVALLKNAKGEIDLNLPVGGSLDDPQFSVFGIVVKIIVNLLVKAATSPFALLGALVGGGEDLAYADFPAGVAVSFASGQEEKLGKIAKALVDRPALKLDIAGRVDPEADGDALRRRALLRKLAVQQQKEQLAKGQASASAETMTIAPADYPRLLKLAYDDEPFAKPKSPAGVAAELSVAEMEKLMLANITVDSDEMRTLGDGRARAAKEALGKAGVAAERMFIVAATADASVKAEDGKHRPRVDFILK